MRKILAMVSITAVLVLCSVQAEAHPSDGYETNPLPPAYEDGSKGYTSNWCTGDLYFPTQFRSGESMSHAEKYIISGTNGSEYGFALRPWKSLVWNMVSSYYLRTGSLPAVLDETTLEVATDGALQAGDPRIDEYRSPVTGEFPRLDAKEFSAGDVYIRPLTTFEIDKYAALDPFYRELWKNSRVWDYDDQEYRYENLAGRIFYMRIYGDSEMLLAGLFFATTPQD